VILILIENSICIESFSIHITVFSKALFPFELHSFDVIFIHVKIDNYVDAHADTRNNPHATPS
jgi:hypothetical protein